MKRKPMRKLSVDKAAKTRSRPKRRTAQNSGGTAADHDAAGRFKKGNAHRWPPGIPSPNPGGRRKSKTLSRAYLQKLRAELPDDPTGRTFAEVIADALVTAAAASGSVMAAMELRRATEGDRVTLTRKHSAEEMTDDELAAIIASDPSGRGAGTPTPASGA